VLTINVKPGWKSGTKITFQREGDQAPNKIPADIVFIIRDKPHQHFRREGSDLRHVCKITLREVNAIYHQPHIRIVDNFYMFNKSTGEIYSIPFEMKKNGTKL
jgi:DnaJ-class molecular chaperone